MKKKLLALLLALTLTLSLAPAAAASGYTAATRERPVNLLPAGDVIRMAAPAPKTAVSSGAIDQGEVYRKMIALKSVYPEGTPWTNENNQYTLSVQVFDPVDNIWYYMIGYGCVAFCYILSDAAFTTDYARNIYDFTYDDVHVGDILRVNNDTHSVSVLEKYNDYVVLAEGNYNASVHWGRIMTRAQVEAADYITTRYPESEAPDTPVAEGFTDVPESAYYADAVDWAVDNGVTKGTSDTTFSPLDTVTRGQAVTFLWRALNSPETDSSVNPFTDAKEGRYYYQPMLWAVAEGVTKGRSATIFDPEGTVSRGELITFLWRAVGMPGATDSKVWYEDAERWASENGLLYGTAEAYATSAPCPRCDVVYYLWKTAGLAE